MIGSVQDIRSLMFVKSEGKGQRYVSISRRTLIYTGKLFYRKIFVISYRAEKCLEVIL